MWQLIGLLVLIICIGSLIPYTHSSEECLDKFYFRNGIWNRLSK